MRFWTEAVELPDSVISYGWEINTLQVSFCGQSPMIRKIDGLLTGEPFVRKREALGLVRSRRSSYDFIHLVFGTRRFHSSWAVFMSKKSYAERVLSVP